MEIDTKSSDKKNITSQSQKSGLLQSIMDSIFRSTNPEAEKKRRLKIIAKNYQKSKFHNFYKPAAFEALPPLAKLFYDIYKIISPAQTVFKTNDNDVLFKRQILSYSLSEKQTELLEHFEENYINELARKAPIDQVKDKISQDLMDFSNEFNSERIAKAENLYKSFILFKDFCTFDYFLFIKKFSSHFVENNFGATPAFEKINAEYIADDLKDFVAVAYNITDDSIIWNDLFSFLTETRGSELVPSGAWRKIVQKIKAIQLSNSFEYMLQHITKNPLYSSKVSFDVQPLIEPYLDKITEDANTLLTKISNAQKDAKTTDLCGQIFGKTDLNALKNYVSSANDPLAKKDLSTFDYCEPLNYLKTFLIEYIKKDMREYYEVIVIRGQWDQTLSAPMSNAYQELLKISEEITTFDNDLAEDGALGQKIKTLLPKTAHDSGAENIINRTVEDANELARSYILQSSQDFITIGKTIKMLLEDYVKPKPVMVQNWRELERFMENPIKDFSVNLYKKIYLFVQLMQQYLK